ncbi:lysophospholipid acyltransferase family protein [Rickettsiales endosymbiont of Peranema trichophorum]|uniref:lysophospholipid acyltransferase family protein n=1 Tax=Rickettsiales endosymbiont of Peranema trichophorum TaxID=2486577 RepID=UPI001023C276|nr:lysophospholipid acyltransferase family protein [Rickettsiales endosymbiont of Peranema trichophorum]
MSSTVIVVRSALFYAIAVIWTALLFFAALPIFVTFNSNIISYVGLLWAKVMLLMLKACCGLSYQVEGLDTVPDTPFIIACKHQSAWETIFLSSCFKNSKFILKKELTYIPFFGWYIILVGMIWIDRKSGIHSLKRIARDVATALNKSDNVVVIFPEGTRTKPLESVEYKSGILAIHKVNREIPIVPVALNSGVFWPKGLLIKPGTVTIKFLEPISHSTDQRQLLKLLKEKIDLESNLLAHYIS